MKIILIQNKYFTENTLVPLTAALCTYENNQCGWINHDKDNFDWKRKQGRTPSIGTGPSVDHTTGGNRGYFMYIETSFGSVGDRANLISPRFQKVGNFVSILELVVDITSAHLVVELRNYQINILRVFVGTS